MQYRNILLVPALALSMFATGCARDKALVDQRYIYGPNALMNEYSDKRGLEFYINIENGRIHGFDFNRDGIADSAFSGNAIFGGRHFSRAELADFQGTYRYVYDDYMRQKQTGKKR